MKKLISIVFSLLAIANLLQAQKISIIHGMNGDGQTDQSVIIQHAIDSCSLAGGGTLVIKAGKYLSNPLYFKSKVNLQIDSGAVLLASDDTTLYKAPKRNIHFINGENLTDVSITGKGVIDGNGLSWWKRFRGGNKLTRPRLIYFTKCTNLVFENITLQNSPSFHLVPSDCENVVIKNIKVFAPDNSPNTDALDPSRCKNVKITGCLLDVGDDNIAIKSGRTRGEKGNPCEDILVENCTFLHGHGMSIGSETTSGVKNLVVKNCKFRDTDNGIRIKSNITLGGAVENVSYTDITMENVKNPIIISFDYKSNHVDGITTDIPSVTGFTITNLSAFGSKNAGKMIGLENSLLQKINLTNVDIQAQTGMVVENARNVIFKNVKVNAKKGNAIMTNNVEGTGF